jgi:beta-N-acetylhexosaminidase
MIDVAGLELTDLERERLVHPLVGGVILFKPATTAIRNNSPRCVPRSTPCAEPALPIAIDHEGRARAALPRRLHPPAADAPPRRAVGPRSRRGAPRPQPISATCWPPNFAPAASTYSFTPVLDLDWGPSGVIGDRAFHNDPEAVAELAGALIEGLRAAGMGCCGKHFPGHGWVAADSHLAIPVDERSLAEMAPDLTPYRRLRLDGVMPAHVIYPQVDSRPAGFSPVWLEKLRAEFKFRRRHLQRRPVDGRRRICRQHGATRRGRLGRRLRHAADLQCAGCRGRGAGKLAADAGSDTCGKDRAYRAETGVESGFRALRGGTSRGEKSPRVE